MIVKEMLRYILFIFFFGIMQHNAENRYDGYKVLQVTPKSYHHKKILGMLQETQGVTTHGEPVLNKPYTLMLAPLHEETFRGFLLSHSLQYKILLNDVQTIVEQQKQGLTQRSSTHEFYFDTYNSLENIEAQLSRWSEKCPTGLACELSDIGTTSGGEQIQTLRIGTSTGSNNVIMMTSLREGQDWLTGATLMKITNHLITGYGTIPEVTQMLDMYDLHILPVYNPDSFLHTVNHSRLYKTTAFAAAEGDDDDDVTICTVDADSSTNERRCEDLDDESQTEDDLYRKEIQRMQESHTIWSVVELLGSNQSVMYPGMDGSTEDMCADKSDQKGIAKIIADVIMATHGTTWTYGPQCNDDSRIYLGNHHVNVQYPFTWGLRGYFPISPTSDIHLSYQEVWNGLVAMTEEITKKHELKSKDRQEKSEL